MFAESLEKCKYGIVYIPKYNENDIFQYVNHTLKWFLLSGYIKQRKENVFPGRYRSALSALASILSCQFLAHQWFRFKKS